MALSTIPLMSWIREHQHLLKPPVGNKNLYNEDGFMVFVVGGPNERTDWHVDPREELFYQIKGDMLLKIREDGEFRDLVIREGDVFLLPANVPHSPQRSADSIGVVVEYARDAGELDALRWYCPQCSEVVYEEWFHLTDTTTQLAPVFKRFYGSKTHRTCRACGHLHPKPD
ncbi:MAG TPA: 3-hydroxyanthranilate 3,4-dioxygenase [Myxococcales bacterium]|nr:3-hydroxyanthranilate 3,4-dioxygenase [Myxococcales bacterium]HAN32364.1 3-hydroxyanthranilate 3,4-dioxygenase [Myxococcales bacterium]